MTNQQKFKTTEERQVAFSEYCKTAECKRCRYNKKGINCLLLWLSDEYEEPKSDLPFYIRKENDVDWYAVCIKSENGDEIRISGSGAEGNMQSICNHLNAAALAWHKRMCKDVNGFGKGQSNELQYTK